MSIGHTPEDELEAIEAALAAVSHIMSDQRAADVLGTSEATVRRWRAGERSPLRKQTREALQRFFGASQGQERTLAQEVAEAALEVINDVERRLEELRRIWLMRLELAKATPPASSASAGAVGEVQTKPLRNAGRAVLKRARQEKAKGRESARGSRSAPDAEVAG